MNFLAKHIELLLLDNDCIIVPRLGGFVAHHSPAVLSKGDQVILPPFRTLGFNPSLKINDGTLAESYMKCYGINFVEATKCIDRDVDELLSTLHEEGKADLPNIGELRFNIHGIYEFTPYDGKLMSPNYYGLDTLPIKELSAITTSVVSAQEEEVKHQEYEDDDDEPKTYVIHLNRTFLRTSIAAAAAIILLLLFPIPFNQGDRSAVNNRAQIVPEELMKDLKDTAISYVSGKQTNKTGENNPQTKEEDSKEKTESLPAVKPNKKEYQLIIASCISKKRATTLVEELNHKGYKEAQVLLSPHMVRVSIAACNSESEAYNLMNKLSKTTEYNNIWVMKSNPHSSVQ